MSDLTEEVVTCADIVVNAVGAALYLANVHPFQIIITGGERTEPDGVRSFGLTISYEEKDDLKVRVAVEMAVYDFALHQLINLSVDYQATEDK